MACLLFLTNTTVKELIHLVEPVQGNSSPNKFK